MSEFNANDLWLIIYSTRWTLYLSVLSFIGGAAGGILIAVLRTNRHLPVRLISTVYIRIFQGTPLIILLLLCFFSPSLFLGIDISPLLSAVIAFSLYASASTGEILRGAIQAVPEGTRDAAKMLGLNSFDSHVFIIFPQALRIATPSLVGFFIQLIKATSLASVIGFAELSRTAQIINNQTFKPFLIFMIVAVIYFLLCWPLSLLGRKLEKSLS
ncbi:amino acid ABC transporter permease [Klebsiella sp. BIGb0407]|uniref:amino acid ABC transporter permease n=1 Tax=Klebsiella sp. BIGb0407 TaxID=2940603 RepID=UPI0021690E24|nr:amino acid ABC transporter permease [Klebsiella sp. BIGb0407]MCS3429866.1 polar amino acid transport system permease protein [Klebsiella sp. BIGb0407]